MLPGDRLLLAGTHLEDHLLSPAFERIVQTDCHGRETVAYCPNHVVFFVLSDGSDTRACAGDALDLIGVVRMSIVPGSFGSQVEFHDTRLDRDGDRQLISLAVRNQDSRRPALQSHHLKRIRVLSVFLTGHFYFLFFFGRSEKLESNSLFRGFQFWL